MKPTLPPTASAFAQGLAAAMAAVFLATGAGDWSRARPEGATWMTGAASSRLLLRGDAQWITGHGLSDPSYSQLLSGSWHDPGGPGADVYLEANRVEGRVDGPVASLRIDRTYRYRREHWGRVPGALVQDELLLSGPTALHDFWITENGAHIPAKVRDHREAARDFARTARAARDPGLLEWHGERRVGFELYPVLLNGEAKQASWRQETLLEANAYGMVELLLPIHQVPTRALAIDLEVHEPRGVRSWELPEGLAVEALGANRWKIRGRYRDLATPPGALPLRWKLARPPGLPSEPAQALRVASGGYLAQVLVPGVAADPVPLTLIGRGAAVPAEAGTLGGPAATTPIRLVAAAAPALPLTVPADTLERLEAVTRILAAQYEPDRRDARARAAAISELSRRHRVVSPATSLYAKPGLIGDDQIVGDTSTLYRAPTALPAGSASAAPVGFGSAFGPSFFAARRRANIRACFANQKTIAGAIEMYNLDYNTDLATSWPSGNRVHPAHVLAGLFRPAPGVAVVGTHPHEFRTPATATDVRWLHTADLASVLEGQGYLQQFPADPGYGAPEHYLLLGGEDLAQNSGSLFCTHHGFIQPPRGTFDPPRQQLLQLGVREPALLALASPEPPSRRPAVNLTHLGELELMALWVLSSLIWTVGAGVPRRRERLAGYLGFLAGSFLLALVYQLADAAPLVRWTLTGGIGAQLLYLIGLALGGLTTPTPARLLGISAKGRAGREAVARSRDHLASLGIGSSALLVLSLVAWVVSPASYRAMPTEVFVGLGAAALAMGTVLGLELSVETLQWIEAGEPGGFWGRHVLRGIALLGFCSAVIGLSAPDPAAVGQAAALTGMLLAPRYGLASSLLRRLLDELGG